MRLWRCFSSRRRAKTRAANSTPQTGQPPPRPLDPRPRVHRVQVNAPLENPPAEVRRHLLSFLQLQELAALVRASPVFHGQYALDRRYLLTCSLDASLGPLTAEADAVSRSHRPGFAEHISKPDVGLFFQQYQDNRFHPSHSLLDPGLSEEETVQAASFYNIAHKVMGDYAKWALTNLDPQTGDGVTTGALTPSQTEKYRLLRSMYRFQLFCNVFGLGPHRAMRPIEERLYGIDIHRHFIVLFEPWEVEEIVCIYFYVKEKYDEIFTKIERDAHPDNPRFDNQRRPPTPDGAFELDTIFRQGLLIGTASHGLELLHAVLFAGLDHEGVISMMQTHISTAPNAFSEDEAIGASVQGHLRLYEVSEREQKQQRRADAV